MTKSKWSRPAIFISGALVSVLCLLVAFRKVNWGGFLDHLQNISFGSILLGLLLVNLGNFTLAKRWHIIVREMIPISYWVAFWSLRISFFFNATLPARLGEPFRIFYIKKKTGLSLSRGVGALGADRFLDFITMVGVLYISVVVLGMRGNLPTVKTIFLIVVLGIIGVIALGHLPKKAKNKTLNKILTTRAQIFEGISPLLKLKVLLPTIPLSLIGWVIQASLVLTFAYSVGAPLSFFKACMVVAAVTIAIAIPSSPGHIGTFELGAITMLTYFKVPASQAATIAVMYHMIQLIPTLLIGAYGYYFHFLSGSKKQDLVLK